MMNPVDALQGQKRALIFLYACFILIFSASSFVQNHGNFAHLRAMKSKDKSTTVVWTSSSSSVTSSYYPSGLLDEESFREKCRLDETFANLRKQLPAVLTKPLTMKDAMLVYDESIQLLGPRGEVLSSGIDELVSLSSTLVATTWSAKTAQEAILSTFSGTRTEESTVKRAESSSYPTVNCTLVWDTSQRVVAKWSTTTVVGGQRVEGISELILKDNRIVTHKLLDVSLDGRTIVAIGETLANLRRAVRSVQFPQNSPLLDAIFEVRNSFLAAAAQSQPVLDARAATENLMSPLFYVHDMNDTINSPSTLFDSKSILIDSSNATAVSLLDDYPLPGSILWKEYAASHKMILAFWKNDLPLLAGEKIVNSYNDLETCNFVSDATLRGPNKKKSTLLLKGGTKIAQAYHTLAALRRASNGVWNIRQARVDWRERTCDIEWDATIPTGIANIEGTDRFTLNENGSIESVQQLKLSVGGNLITDPEPIRAFLSTLEAYDGVLLASAGGDIMTDLRQRLDRVLQGSTPAPRSIPQSTTEDLPPQLGTEAAASVYNIMRILHEDLSSVQDLVVAPASSFLEEDVTLQGYLGETLAKGASSYRQSIGLMLASLRGAIRAKSAALDKQPKVTIEFTRKGDLKVSLELGLTVNPLLGTNPIAGTPTFPLKIEVVSEYRLKNGRIRKHVLLESRINDQLTPGDVVTRWMKGILNPEQQQTSKSMNDGVSALLDIVSWARSMGRGAS